MTWQASPQTCKCIEEEVPGKRGRALFPAKQGNEICRAMRWPRGSQAARWVAMMLSRRRDHHRDRSPGSRFTAQREFGLRSCTAPSSKTLLNKMLASLRSVRGELVACDQSIGFAPTRRAELLFPREHCQSQAPVTFGTAFVMKAAVTAASLIAWPRSGNDWRIPCH